MADLLLEIGTDGMPIDEVSSCAVELSLLVGKKMSGSGLQEEGIHVIYTLRRLALIMQEVTRQDSSVEEVLESISRILGGIMTTLTRQGVMRSDSSPATSIRPIQHLVCLYGEQVVPLHVRNVIADRVTRGHWRTNQEEEIALSSATDYEQALARGGVIVDQEKRKKMVRDAVAVAASEASTSVRIDESLLEKIVDGSEYPQPVTGRVNMPSDLPVMFVNAALREAGFVSLATGQERVVLFIGFADGPVDRDVVREGYERVARSGLRGCKALFSRDRKASLADHVRNLRGISDKSGLGSLWEKTERLRTLSAQIAQAIDASQEAVDRAAFLSQADLVTWIVREFPSLHRIAAAIYAKLDGEELAVCDALEEAAVFTLETGQVPTNKEGFAIAIAQRYDDLCSLLLAGSNMQDPQVNSAADDLIGLMIAGRVDLDLNLLLDLVSEQYQVLVPTMKIRDLEGVLRTGLEDRLVKYLETSEQITSQISSAIPQEVRANPYRSRVCAQALQEASSQQRFLSLLNSFRSLGVLLHAEARPTFDPALFQGETERALWREYLKAEGKIEGFLARLDYKQALDQLVTFTRAIDRYTKDVDSHTGSVKVRNNRQGLIASVVDLFTRVGNFDALLTMDDHVLGEDKR